MRRKVRVAQYGVGFMGSRIARYAYWHGAELVAAFDTNPAILGKDLGEVIGIGAIGVAIQDISQAELVLRDKEVDICMIATKGDLPSIAPAFRQCAAAGVNAITIGERAAWPWTEEPDLSHELDELAKAHGVTFAASGIPEVSWGAIMSTMAGACPKVERIKLTSVLNLDEYGSTVVDLYKDHGVDLTMDEFQKEFGDEIIEEMDGHIPCFCGDQNSWMCAYMGLTPVKQYAKYTPLTYKEPVYSALLKRDIPAGNLLGLSLNIITETQEGVTIEYEMAGKVYSPEDEDHIEFTIYGEPKELRVVIEKPDTPALTGGAPVNRIPDVINARPGYVTTEEFPRNRYLARPLNEYIMKED